MKSQRLFAADIEHFLQEDDLSRHHHYSLELPQEIVHCSLKIKSDCLLTGLPYFFAVFKSLGAEISEDLEKDCEGKNFLAHENKTLDFTLPFSVALTGERLALNLLAHCSKISSFTKQFVDKARKYNISILDTRKTTPGLRSLEKYAVRMGGGHNHRFGQTDLWMVKDNHKSFFGGLAPAVEFFQDLHGFYTPIVAEIHDLFELEEAISLELKHVMLDNFSVLDLKKAIDLKPDFMSYEVSGGINLENIDHYLISGIDAISVGKLTYGAPPVDFSLKYKRVE